MPALAPARQRPPAPSQTWHRTRLRVAAIGVLVAVVTAACGDGADRLRLQIVVGPEDEQAVVLGFEPGDPLPALEVRVISPSGAAESEVTDTEGRVTFAATPGRYEVRAAGTTPDPGCFWDAATTVTGPGSERVFAYTVCRGAAAAD